MHHHFIHTHLVPDQCDSILSHTLSVYKEFRLLPVLNRITHSLSP